MIDEIYFSFAVLQLYSLEKTFFFIALIRIRDPQFFCGSGSLDEKVPDPWRIRIRNTAWKLKKHHPKVRLY